ncbi:MAG: hypothetical protein E7Z95_01530 [Actinomyces succiniciruminis]|nr:hypothetical protein [Actinomyces succiniciruminis]
MRHYMTLGELCDGPGGAIQTGPFGTQLHASDYSEEGVAVIMPQDISPRGFVNGAKVKRVPHGIADELRRHELKAGDIVYSRRGDVEKCALVTSGDLPAMCGTGCLLLRPSSDSPVDPRFLNYRLACEDVRAWIRGHAVGATMPNLNTQILSQAPIVLPSLKEQQAIAEVLGALDDKIAANDSLVRCAERLMESLVEGLTPTTYLGNIVRLSKKQVSPNDLDGVSVQHYSVPAFDQSRLPSEGPAGSILSAKFAIESPSVLLSKLNPRFPRVWNVLHPSEISLASTEFLVLVPQELPTSALWAVLSLARTKAFLVERVSGTSGSHQRVRPQEALQIPVPDVSQFDAGLLERLDVLGETADICRRASHTLAKLRDALLPPLMDGTLRVKDAVAQVEEVL